MLLAGSAFVSGCVAHAPMTTGPASDGVESDSASVAVRVEAMREALNEIPLDDLPAAIEARREAAVDPVITERFSLAAGQRVVGQVQVMHARAEDTFSDIARTYSLGYDELLNANPDVDPWLPGEGTPIVLPTQYLLPDTEQVGIVLNIAAKRLYYFPEPKSGEPRHVFTYPIGIGRLGWATPVGQSKVIAKAKNPTWYVPWSVRQEHREMGDPLPAVVPPGEDNPLGHRVLKLDLEGYLIHGTNQPYGVGMRVSHGCVRLYPEHIEILYDAVGLGIPVEIVNQPLLAAQFNGNVYVQSHPHLEDDEVSLDEHREHLSAKLAEYTDLSADRVETVASEARGYPIAVRVADEKQNYSVLVKNVVVVDNPVAEDDLADMMSLTEEAMTQVTDD